MIETRQITEHAEKIVADLAETFGDEDGFVRSVVIAVELDTGPRTHYAVESADDRPWVQVAFLREVADHLEEIRYAMAAAQSEDDE